MPYNCVVCVKQVPDTKHITGDAMKPDGTVSRATLPAILNPEDLNALEEALAIRDRYGGNVTAITMGLPKARSVLREALYRGADRALLITDRRAAGSDTLATSYILSCAVRKLRCDVVLCGRQAIDGDTAQVGPQMAEKLGFAQITYLEELVELEESRVTGRRNMGTGWEIVTAELPVLLTVTEAANVPRPPSAKRMMQYKKACGRTEIEQAVKAQMASASPQEQAAEVGRRFQATAARGMLIEEWDLDDCGADPAWCGLAGSPTKVHRVQSIVLAGGDYKQFEPTDQGVAALVGELIEEHTIG